MKEQRILKTSDENQIIRIIIDAYKRATKVQVEDKKKGDKNREKSTAFIGEVRKGLEDYFLKVFGKGYATFSRNKSNKVFRLNELLYDIHVCKIGSFPSQPKNVEISFVEKSIVQMESEFSNYIRDSTLDFSKLVCGRAELKIMVLPLTNEGSVERYCDSFKELTKGIPEPLYLCFIKHPRDWDDKCHYKVVKFENSQRVPCCDGLGGE